MAMTKKAKAWVIGGSIGLGIVVVAILGIFLAGMLTAVPKEDYAKAATTAIAVTKQADAYGAVGQQYINLAAISKPEDTNALEDLRIRTSTALDATFAVQDELSKSPALRDAQVKSAYDTYNRKARVFKSVSLEYRTSLPLFVKTTQTCNQLTRNIGKTDIRSLANRATEELFLVGASKQEVLDNFDAKTKDCLASAVALKASGANSFAKIGGLLDTQITTIRTAIVARYDAIPTIGYDGAKQNYDDTINVLNKDLDQTVKDITNQQKEEGQNGDFTNELEALTKVLQGKS